jgi:hypothetical protein
MACEGDVDCAAKVAEPTTNPAAQDTKSDTTFMGFSVLSFLLGCIESSGLAEFRIWMSNDAAVVIG